MKSEYKTKTHGPLVLRRLRIAYHEIGHVIVYYHFKMPFDYVTIEPRRGLAGHVKCPQDERHLTPNEVEKFTVMFLAGEMLDRTIFGWHHKYACGARGDIEAIYRINDFNPHPLLNGDKEKHHKFFYRNGRRALEILNLYMDEIHALAHELKVKKKLDQNEVLRVIQNHRFANQSPRLPRYEIVKQVPVKRTQNRISFPLANDDLPF